ncbi:WD40-repeat-containing domain protein [Haematococcus lacustris]
MGVTPSVTEAMRLGASPPADRSSLLLDGRGEEGACAGLLWGGRPVLQPQPLAVLGGHQEAVLDLSWSPASTLLLTASADNTVQLWPLQPAPLTPHRAAGGGGAGAGAVCVQEQLICLQEYPHPDIVTCVAWHPLDSRLFVTGCGDGRLRVWSAGDCLVLATASLPHDLLTACDWAHDGSSVVAGTLHGKCKYFGWTASPSRNIAEQQHQAGLQSGTAPHFGNAGSTPHLPGLTVKQSTQTAPKACAVSGALTSGRLEYAATVDVRDRRRAAGPGSKVTSVVALPGQHESFLVASNDSRIRRYTRYALEVKYKGLRSTNTMVRVSVTSDGKHLVSGADNGWVHVWDTSLYEPEPAASASLQQGKGAYRAVQKLRSKNGFCDSFATEEQCVTCAMVAPPASWRLNRAQAQRRLIEVLNAAGGTTSSASSRLSDKRGLQSAKRAPGEEEEAPRASDTTLNALAATLNSALLGAAFLVGGFSGRLLVYENV